MKIPQFILKTYIKYISNQINLNAICVNLMQFKVESKCVMAIRAIHVTTKHYTCNTRIACVREI